MTRPTRHPRTGIYWVRKGVPKALRAHLGRWELAQSLGTKDPAEAKRLAPAIIATFDAQVAEAKRRLASGETVQPVARLPGEEDIRAAVRRWFHDRTRAAMAEPFPDDPDTVLAELRELEAAVAHPEQGRQDTEASLRRMLKGFGFGPPPPALLPFGVELLRAAILDALALSADRLQGQGTITIRSPALTGASPLDAAPPPPASTKAVLTVADLIKRYQAAPERQHLGEKNGAGYALALRALRETVGEGTPADAVSRDDARKVMAVLLAAPVNASLRYPKLSLADAAARAKADKKPVLAPRTVVNLLANLSALWRWGTREAGLSKNPFEGLSAIVKTGTAAVDAQREKRRPFTGAELKTIFGADLYRTRPERNSAALWWCPLLGLFAGLRLNEAAQLHVADVVETDGVHLLRITAQGGQGKSIKTRAAERRIPVHPELVRCGFLDHVQRQRGAGETRIFPDADPGARKMSRSFGRFLDALGITSPGAVFHSTRHTFRDALREAHVPRDIARALGGWSDTGADAGYGQGYSARTLAEHLARLSYPDVDLAHLHIASTVRPLEVSA